MLVVTTTEMPVRYRALFHLSTLDEYSWSAGDIVRLKSVNGNVISVVAWPSASLARDRVSFSAQDASIFGLEQGQTLDVMSDSVECHINEASSVQIRVSRELWVSAGEASLRSALKRRLSRFLCLSG